VAISVGMHEAKTTLSRLVDAAQSGEEVVITRRGEPVVKLQPLAPAKPRVSLYGSLKGQIKMADDFDELPEDILKAFEGDDPDDPLC
jgi:prevent-host-death family protein